jgi:ATP-dependent DNA helicase RecG
MRAQDDEYYIKLVTDFIKKFGKATREDVDKLLSGKLSDTLDDGQKVKKIGNLLTKMRRSEIIFNNGSRTAPEWKLAESLQKEKS